MKTNEKIHFLFSRFTKHEKEPVMTCSRRKQIINSEGTLNIIINLCLEIDSNFSKSPRCTFNQIYYMPGKLKCNQRSNMHFNEGTPTTLCAWKTKIKTSISQKIAKIVNLYTISCSTSTAHASNRRTKRSACKLSTKK